MEIEYKDLKDGENVLFEGKWDNYKTRQLGVVRKKDKWVIEYNGKELTLNEFVMIHKYTKLYKIPIYTSASDTTLLYEDANQKMNEFKEGEKILYQWYGEKNEGTLIKKQTKWEIHNRFVLPINMGNLREGILILYKYDPQEASLIQQRKEQIRQEDEKKYQAAEAERVKNKAEYEELNRRYIESRTEAINDARNASRGLGGKRTRVKRKIRKTKKLK
jgi:hypothetical protein